MVKLRKSSWHRAFGPTESYLTWLLCFYTSATLKHWVSSIPDYTEVPNGSAAHITSMQFHWLCVCEAAGLKHTLAAQWESNHTCQHNNTMVHCKYSACEVTAEIHEWATTKNQAASGKEEKRGKAQGETGSSAAGQLNTWADYFMSDKETEFLIIHVQDEFTDWGHIHIPRHTEDGGR